MLEATTSSIMVKLSGVDVSRLRRSLGSHVVIERRPAPQRRASTSSALSATAWLRRALNKARRAASTDAGTLSSSSNSTKSKGPRPDRDGANGGVKDDDKGGGHSGDEGGGKGGDGKGDDKGDDKGGGEDDCVKGRVKGGGEGGGKGKGVNGGGVKGGDEGRTCRTGGGGALGDGGTKGG